jgi:serine/threonine protein kinase
MTTKADDTPTLTGLKYQVESVLHSEGPTTVLRVNDPAAFSRRYALKVIKREKPEHDALLARARAAVEASAKLKHESVLAYYDFKPVKKLFRVVRGELLMEYVEGKPLGSLTGLSVAHWMLVFRQVASALAHMHRRKVLHGDLEPGHVVLGRLGTVKVLDYGLALVPAEQRPQPSSLYAAPEIKREGRILESSDVYALGAVMYHMLTGRPFRAAKSKGDDEEAVKAPPPASLNPKIPAALSNLIVECLHRHAPRRVQSPYDVFQKLDELAGQSKLDADSLRGLAAEPA